MGNPAVASPLDNNRLWNALRTLHATERLRTALIAQISGLLAEIPGGATVRVSPDGATVDTATKD